MSSSNEATQNINGLVNPLLTDFYQLSMTYSYWKSGRHSLDAVFDIFFRKNPFGGEFTVFAGISEALKFIRDFKYTDSDIAYVKTLIPHAEPEFWEWLRSLDCSKLKVFACKEGSVVFPRTPLVRLEGPLAIIQLLETTLLNLLNFASLMVTNAVRFRHAAGNDKTLLEFGLRRAQGPDGAMSASLYAYMGGFDGTSNVLAGKLHGIPVKGTHAHAFVQSMTSLDNLTNVMLKHKTTGEEKNLLELTLKYRRDLDSNPPVSNEGELAAFVCYALCYPDGFLALVDTYDTLKSGVPNFLCVSLALYEMGYKSKGIRLDSGDLAYLSKMTRKQFIACAKMFSIPEMERYTIVASNDINEDVLIALKDQKHEIDAFGIGTNLVTCQKQPALGMVFKLVEINGHPRIKLSQDIEKVTIPGRKEAYRLIGKDGTALLDLICRKEDVQDVPPVAKGRTLCRHPFDGKRRAYVTPQQVVNMHQLMWDGEKGGVQGALPTLMESRQYVKDQLAVMREDILRPMNPTPYKVSVSPVLYDYMHNLWLSETPVADLS